MEENSRITESDIKFAKVPDTELSLELFSTEEEKLLKATEDVICQRQ